MLRTRGERRCHHSHSTGVGTESLHLPVPSTAPLGFSLLLKQCWNDHAKHRPKFRQILLHLEILQGDDAFAVPDVEFYATQRGWREEMAVEFEKMKQAKREMQRVDQELLRRRDQELAHAQDVRQLYEARLDMVSTLIAELRERERDLDQREKQQQRKRTKPRATSKRGGYTKNTTARRRSKGEGLTRRKSDATDSGVESRTAFLYCSLLCLSASLLPCGIAPTSCSFERVFVYMRVLRTASQCLIGLCVICDSMCVCILIIQGTFTPLVWVLFR